jgi:hypothetical protein
MKCLGKFKICFNKLSLIKRNNFYTNAIRKFSTTEEEIKSDKSTNDNIEIENYPDLIKHFFENNIKSKKLPCFEVYSSQVEILNQPFDFYLAIIVRDNFFNFNIRN